MSEQVTDPNPWIEIHHPGLPGTGTVLKKRRTFENVLRKNGWVEGAATVEPDLPPSPSDEAFTPSPGTVTDVDLPAEDTATKRR